jgi:molybdenum cofactor sulfurtransferase
LDHAGATLYSRTQILEGQAILLDNLLGNPHTASPSSINATDRLDEARSEVLKFVGASASEYAVVFTSGATGALKLLAECFPWTAQSKYEYLNVNHTSVVGIREYVIVSASVLFSDP